MIEHYQIKNDQLYRIVFSSSICSISAELFTGCRLLPGKQTAQVSDNGSLELRQQKAQVGVQ